MAGLRKSELHSLIRDALGDKIDSHGSVEAVPFVVQPNGLVKLAMWAYTVTSPPGGRHPLESKIQLILPGQRKGERADFKPPDNDTFMILIGVKPEEEIFVLWDAYKHRAFPHSKNVQVKAGPLLDAQTFGIGRTTRRVATGEECVIAARSDHLFEALRERIAT